jgi:mannitol operon repressor
MARNKSNSAPLDDWKGFYDALQKETPRAAVIIAAAFIDGWLRRLLENMMVNDPKVVETLLGSEENADCPLSTFSARIKATYCLGLVSKHEYDDLNLLRKIRNQCAHRLHGFSFDEQKIVSWCNSLKFPKEVTSAFPTFQRNHQSLFLLGVLLLAIRLSLREIAGQGKQKIRPKEFETARLVRLIKSQEKRTPDI